MIYLIVFAYILFLAIRFDRDSGRINRKSRMIHQVILFFALSLISGFSYRLGIDCIRYEMKFNMVTPIDQFSTIQLLLNSYDLDPLWTIINSVLKLYTSEFYVLHLIVTLFVNGVIFWFVNKHSHYFFTAILLYYLINYWNFNFEVLRESVSVSFFLLALDHIIGGKKNLVKYYIFALPALFFQTFGFVVLLLPLIRYLNVQKNVKKAIIITVILTPVLFIFMNWITESGLIPEEASMKMEEGYLRSSSSFNIFGIILTIATIVFPSIYIVFKTKWKIDDGLRSYGYIYPLVIITTFGYYMMYRMNNYICIPFIICAAQYLHDSLKKVIVIKLMIFLVFMTSTVLKDFDESSYRRYIPYSSIFDKKIDSRREHIYNTWLQ